MKKSIFIIIIFLIVIAISIGLILPSFQRSQNLSIGIQQKEKELKDFEEYLSHLQNISLQLKDFASQLAKIDQALSQDFYLPNLLEFCRQEAARNGLNFEQIAIGQTASLEGKERLKERTVNLKISGPYPNFKNFLISLGKSARIIEVGNISFSAESVKEAPIYDLIIKVHSY
jgi:Tfp pilus assembly protein PilO